jgi:2-polyprenyl-3-methyl-5-hydroxy-6-metoxy-1,4-benzoquinol methylase
MAKIGVYEKYYLNSEWQKKVISSNNFTYRPIVKVIDGLLNEDKTILDIGCGVGTLDFYMAPRCRYITGLDLSEKAISNALKSKNLLGFENIDFYCQNILDFRTNERFDFILCSEVLEHIKSDSYFFKKVKNFLKHDGKVLLTTPLDSAPLYKLGLTKMFDKRVGHLRRYSFKSLKKVISKSGFEIENVVYGEGIFRNTLFVFSSFGPIIRVGNKFQLISHFLTCVDNIFIKLLGPSNIYLTVTKQ